MPCRCRDRVDRARLRARPRLCRFDGVYERQSERHPRFFSRFCPRRPLYPLSVRSLSFSFFPCTAICHRRVSVRRVPSKSMSVTGWHKDIPTMIKKSLSFLPARARARVWNGKLFSHFSLVNQSRLIGGSMSGFNPKIIGRSVSARVSRAIVTIRGMTIELSQASVTRQNVTIHQVYFPCAECSWHDFCESRIGSAPSAKGGS